MRWYVWLLLSPLILVALAFLAVVVDYELSPEGRENREVRRRMDANARRARRELYEAERERVRQQLRAEQRDDTTYRRAFREDS